MAMVQFAPDLIFKENAGQSNVQDIGRIAMPPAVFKADCPAFFLKMT